MTKGTDAIVAFATEIPEAGTGCFIDRFGDNGVPHEILAERCRARLPDVTLRRR